MPKLVVFIVFAVSFAEACLLPIINGEPKTIEIVRFDRSSKKPHILGRVSVTLDGILQIRDILYSKLPGTESIIEMPGEERYFELSPKFYTKLKSIIESKLSEVSPGEVFSQKSLIPVNRKLAPTRITKNLNVKHSDPNFKAQFQVVYGDYLAVKTVELFEDSRGFFLQFPISGYWKGRRQNLFNPLFTEAYEQLLSDVVKAYIQG